MAKITFPLIQQGLRTILGDETLTQKALTELKRLSLEKEADGPDKEPAEKKVFLVIKPDDTAEIAWVIKYPESLHPSLVPEKLLEAIASYNSSRKGQLHPAKSLGEALEMVPARFFKEYNLSVSTKLPVTMLAMKREVEMTSLKVTDV